MQEIRVGKLKAAIGFFNEVRKLPLTRPGIFIPQGIYWGRMRNTRSFYDGAQYFYEHRGELDTFSFCVGAGQQKVDQDEMDSLMELPKC